MKITKLMLSAFVAAFALVACNKDETTPENTSLKTVSISLENIITTNGPAGDKIQPDANGKMPVNVNNIKIFLTDGSYSPGYSAQDVNGGVAQTYFDLTAPDAINLGDEIQFHYVDHKCNKVVVVANVDEDVTLNDIKNNTGVIADQQDQNTLILWAESALRSTGEYHTNEETGKHTEVYEAALTLKPVISRFEIDGFRVAFSDPAKFNSIAVTAVAFQNYYESFKFAVGSSILPTPSDIKNHVTLGNESAVFNWFNNSATSAWYIDKFEASEMTMTPGAPAADCAPRAYHFYAGNAVPTMIVTLLADGNPAYVYAEEYMTAGGVSIANLEPGKIYRMSAAGEVAGDGSVIIPDDLDPIERCIDITVDVVDWVVELITPQF